MLIVLIVIFIIFPGLYVYLSGHRFLKMEHDDVFAQKYFKYQQRASIALWVSPILLILLITMYLPKSSLLDYFNYYTLGLGTFLIFFIAYISYLIGFALIDRVVRDNHVGLFARIRFNITMLLLLAWPYIFISIVSFSAHDYFICESIFAIFGYAFFYFFVPDIWVAVLCARPVADNTLRNKINEIACAEKTPVANIYAFNAGGIKVANAFMVGNWGTEKAIFISKYAHNNLTSTDLEGIYMHEIGHLQKNQVVSRSVAMAIPIIFIPMIHLIIGKPGFLIQAGIFVAALLLIKLFIPSQKFEKEADEFAARYSSTPGNLISGLEKIYALGLLPKRFSLPEETRMSHPSLAHRIKHIRKFSRQSLPVLEDRKEYQCQGNMVKITFSAATFTVLYRNNIVTTKLYSDVLAMYTSPARKGCRLLIKFKDKGKVEKIKLNAPVAEINAVVDIIEYSFADQPAVDPAQFARAFTVQSILMIILGTIMLFLGAPAMLVLGIIGLISKTKRLLLSYAVSSLVVAAGMLSVPLQKYLNAKPLVFVFGIFCLLALYDFARFARLEEKAQGRGRISLTSTIIGSLVSLVVLFTLVMLNISYIAAAGYSVIFVNLCALNIGLALAYNPKELSRIILVCVNILMLLVFAINRWF